MKRALAHSWLSILVVGLLLSVAFESGNAANGEASGVSTHHPSKAASDAAPTKANPDADRDIEARHPVVIEYPTTLGKVTTDLRDAAGRAIGIECATCHAPGDGPALAQRAKAPADFHAGIELKHGNLPCKACHDPVDRTRLRLASGETLEMGDVITLCGQCHSSQLRSYEHLAHGGARGYWDRSKGPTLRNSCINCHAAHAPAYPLVVPAPGPNDRFLTPHPTKNAAQTEVGSKHE